MIKSIIVATIMTTAFTFVSISTASITIDQAYAGKKKKKKVDKEEQKVEKVGRKKGDRLYQNCVLNGGSVRVSSTGANSRCCSEKGNCITCPTTTTKGSCKKKWAKRIETNKPRPSTGSSGTQLAPAKDKPKKSWPSPIGTYNKAPVRNAPTKDKPKTGPTINKNRIQ